MLKKNPKVLLFVVPPALAITILYKAQSDNYKNDLKKRIINAVKRAR
jgi:chromate transport protein ChrA